MTGAGRQYRRLSLADRTFLRIERPAAPAHIAGLCVVEPGPLLGVNGEPDLATIERRLERRLLRVPELRRIVHRPPPLCGPPLWVDDPRFSIDRHVHVAAVAGRGDEADLLETAELLLRPVLDRSRPLWELWFLTGLDGGHLGVLFKIHHAVADGLAAIALVASLLDLEPDAPDPPAAAWVPAPAPSAWTLFADNLRTRLASAGSTLAHPIRLGRAIASTLADPQFLGLRTPAPRTSLNALPGPGRRTRVVHMDLEAARAVAHAHGAKVNDVVLSVVIGGVHDLLAGRGEAVVGLELRVSVPATLRSAETARELGNMAGVMLVPLPAGEPDSVRRLETIAASTRAAKAEQHPARGQALIGWLAAVGLARSIIARQPVVNFFVTDVPGPSVPLYILGARIEDVMPVTALAGNVTLTFAALSYCGRLNLVVNADSATCPDIDVLAAGMTRSWEELASQPASVQEAGRLNPCRPNA